MKKTILALSLIIILSLVLTACTQTNTSQTMQENSKTNMMESKQTKPVTITPETKEIKETTSKPVMTKPTSKTEIEKTQEIKESTKTMTNDWKSISLTDINTNKQYKMSDFKGKTILIESFAVWCPTCTKQQKEMKKHKESSQDVIHIALDTDPNEDISKVKKHIESNNFNWYYSIAPTKLTKDLINEFGIGVVNAPSAPVIVVCKDQSAKLISKRGVKTAEELDKEISKICTT